MTNVILCLFLISVSPNVLRKEKIPIMNTSKCRSLYKSDTITPHMLCAGYEEGGVDTCQGDSGGPLVCQVNGMYFNIYLL